MSLGNYLEASVSPGNVTTGVPVQRTSIDVVCPLHNGVSRHISANCPRRTCSSFAATFENIIRPPGKPGRKNNSHEIHDSPNGIQNRIKKRQNKQQMYLDFVPFVVDLVHQQQGNEATIERRLEHFSILSPMIPMSMDQFYTID